MNRKLNEIMITVTVGVIVGTLIGFTMLGAVEAYRAILWLFN